MNHAQVDVDRLRVESSPRRGSEESEEVRVREEVHVAGVMIKCGVTYDIP